MCGLTGFWEPPGAGEDALAARARAMAGAIAHRGPDDDGVFVEPAAGFGLGFRRLAIVDLSPTGHQPMTSSDGRYVMAFNGEIYNYRDLRAALERDGARFRGTSDTEVALELIRRDGVEAVVRRLWGMFAIVVWDRRERRAWLLRDRLGKKPLYYGRANGTWLFGSELKALRAHPAFDPAIDRGAVRAFLRYGYVPAPATIYRAVAKLPPGSFARLEADGACHVEAYWRVREAAEAGVAARPTGPTADRDVDAHVDALEALLGDAVARRMIADVPLGAFLSGGIDSSVVVALMQKHASRPVRTFTIGFEDAGFDEAAPAAAVARHLGTDHTTFPVTGADALQVVPRLPALYDEPFADASQIPTFLVSALARQAVTVALSGDGGDEVFGGYTRHVWLDRLRRRARLMPAVARRAVGGALGGVEAATWDAIYAGVSPAMPARLRQRHPGEKIHKLARVVAADDEADAYTRLVSQWEAPETLVPGATEAPTWADAEAADAALDTPVDRTILRDFVAYLPDDILVKVDRASMGVSLEARAPMLDHRVVEWAWRLPLDLKVRDAQGKWLLRRLLDRHVPRALVERPKSGFAIPLDAWLRGPLRDWAEALLTPARLASGGLLDPAPVAAVWQRHLARGGEAGRLWPVLMLQAWREAVGA
jgi:asparagine synthase (glutamine-hydrolysing)